MPYYLMIAYWSGGDSVCGWRISGIAGLEGVHESPGYKWIHDAMVGHSHRLVDGRQGSTADETGEEGSHAMVVVMVALCAQSFVATAGEILP
jgi:hypothetical protein